MLQKALKELLQKAQKLWQNKLLLKLRKLELELTEDWELILII